MAAFTVTLSLPKIENSPTFSIDVTARSEDEALDLAFDKAFAYYPQYGAFKIDEVIERKADD